MRMRNVDEILELIGSNHRYQITVAICLVFIGISCEVAFIGVPIMETSPIVSYYDINGNIHKQLINYTLCDQPYTILYEESKSSWAIDYNMFCDKFKIGLLGSLLCIGGIVGSAFLQYLKLKGPMFSLWFSGILLFLSTFLLLSNNIIYLYLANFFGGLSNIMSFMLRINIMTEITGSKYRAYYNNVVLSSGIFATIILYFLFDIRVNWRIIYFGNAIMVLISCFFLRNFTVENFRFYQVNKDYKNMIESILYINKFNGNIENPDLEDEISNIKELMNQENKNNNLDSNNF